MRNRTLADLDRVVALGGGHGLGRVLSSLSSLGSRLTGIVTTTDNGGSTGRIRRSEGGTNVCVDFWCGTGKQSHG
ncbi:2-phospho-L-lactate transferase CofD family protein, partial [Escherichia sp. TWPC-MK]